MHPEYPFNAVPSWARPHIASAIGSGLLVVACIVGAYCLAAVL